MVLTSLQFRDDGFELVGGLSPALVKTHLRVRFAVGGRSLCVLGIQGSNPSDCRFWLLPYVPGEPRALLRASVSTAGLATFMAGTCGQQR